MARIAAAALIAAVAGTTGAAHAAGPPATPPFPDARNDVAVTLWLKHNTSLPPGQSVVFGPDNVLVVVTDDAPPGAAHRVSLRQEATSIDFVARTGGRSVNGVVDIDCKTRHARPVEIALYAGSDLSGDRISTEGPDQGWRAPRPGSAAAIALDRVCNPFPTPGLAAAPAQPPATKAPPAPAGAAKAQPAPPPPPRGGASASAATAGAVQVQIGAFNSRAAAEEAWDRLSRRFPDTTSGKSVRIEPILVNGRQFFRTSIVGFASASAAKAACDGFSAAGQACFLRR